MLLVINQSGFLPASVAEAMSYDNFIIFLNSIGTSLRRCYSEKQKRDYLTMTSTHDDAWLHQGVMALRLRPQGCMLPHDQKSLYVQDCRLRILLTN